MSGLALLIRHKLRIINIANAPVHIPFYIGNVPGIQNAANHLIKIIAYTFPSQIQYELASPPSGFPARQSKCPVRMFFIEPAVLVHHLRLYPYPKRKPFFFNPLNQLMKAHPQFFFIREPIPKP